jgi:hypothetical protein
VFRENEEKGDSMRALENRTLESKREMDILDALEEIKERNARSGQMDTSAILGESLSNVWLFVLWILPPYVWHHRSLACMRENSIHHFFSVDARHAKDAETVKRKREQEEVRVLKYIDNCS